MHKTKKSTEEPHEEQSSTENEEVSDDVEESEESEETDEDEEEKSEHKSKRTSINLDDPGVLLDPKQWELQHAQMENLQCGTQCVGFTRTKREKENTKCTH